MRTTVPDWVAQAKAAADPAVGEYCLDAAAAQATRCHEWRLILGALDRRHPSRVGAVVGETLRTAAEEGEVWGFRDAASALAALLDDAAGARAALEAGLATFAARERSGYVWALLAAGFTDTLDDPDGARRCLRLGVSRVRAEGDLGGLCSIAVLTAQLGDRPAAQRLLAEAAGPSGLRAADAWSVANAWRALDEPARAAAVLDGALDRAKDVADRLVVARAWWSHDHGVRAARALKRARAVAAAAPDWLAIAETAYDLQADEDQVRSALTRAAKLARDQPTRDAVAAAFRQLLNDPAAAERVGGPGLPPEQLLVPGRTLAGWQPSASQLLDWLRERVTDEVIEEIAAADYGHDFERHRAALVEIRRTGRLPPAPLPWYPGEVLRLQRWSDGAAVDQVMRAWCCALLACYQDEEPDTVVPGLVASCLALGGEAPGGAERMLAWRCSSQPADWPPPDDEAEPDPVWLLGLVLLRVADDPGDGRLPGLVEAIRTNRTWLPEPLPELIARSVSAREWDHLIRTLLVPAGGRPPVAELLTLLDR